MAVLLGWVAEWQPTSCKGKQLGGWTPQMPEPASQLLVQTHLLPPGNPPHLRSYHPATALALLRAVTPASQAVIRPAPLPIPTLPPGLHPCLAPQAGGRPCCLPCNSAYPCCSGCLPLVGAGAALLALLLAGTAQRPSPDSVRQPAGCRQGRGAPR